jgi:hypothetical protein
MPRQRIIGLVEIPALHALNTGKPDAATAPVTLRSEPRRDSMAAVTVQDRSQLVSLEHGYEEISAAVYSQASFSDGTWYKLGYAVGDKTGFAWLDSAAVGVFRNVHTLVHERMAYLTNDWDLRLYAQPESQAAARKIDGLSLGGYEGAHILGMWTERATSEDWYLVAVTRGRCGDGPLEVVATGWVRAYAPNGANTVWYYSRGC